MPTPIDLFDYNLPQDFIAQLSVEPRDHSRLMVLNRATGDIAHYFFYELPALLRPDDVLVFNKTKVFKARLHGDVNGVRLELFLLRGHDVTDGSWWYALAKPGKKLRVGSLVDLNGILAKVLEKHDDGTLVVAFTKNTQQIIEFANQYGDVPVPPYVKQHPENLEQYQTVYAKNTGSVAAPTAGFHFTEKSLSELKQKGIQQEFVTLHVGLGTFQPVKTQTLEEHAMHSEYVEVDEGTAKRINEAKKQGRRIIAVGTTTVRTLEAIGSPLRAFSGDVNIFITPGYKFKMVDGMITNFHLPKSTLLVLVSAFAGREHILEAYEQAKQNKYRFYSFGDAMLIV